MPNRKCNIQDCNLEADYKAPSSPNELKKYIWFCLKHIKEYNKKWNFFSNMTADEIEEFIKDDVIGHRKTKKIGNYQNNYFEKASKIDESISSLFNGVEKLKINPYVLNSRYSNALVTLEITSNRVSLEEIKGAFKRIVKELHPDTVGKNKNNTEKLTKVLEAYKILKDYNEQFKIPNIK